KRFVELFPGVRVLDRELQTGLGRTGATRAECCAAEIEHRQRDLETFPWRSENIFLWHFNVAQRETPRRRATDSHLRHSLLKHLESRHVGRHEKRRDRSFVRARHWRARHHRELVRDRRVGDVTFFAVQNEVRAVLAWPRLHLYICRVGSSFFFRERECAQLLT